MWVPSTDTGPSSVPRLGPCIAHVLVFLRRQKPTGCVLILLRLGQ